MLRTGLWEPLPRDPWFYTPAAVVDDVIYYYEYEAGPKFVGFPNSYRVALPGAGGQLSECFAHVPDPYDPVQSWVHSPFKTIRHSFIPPFRLSID